MTEPYRVPKRELQAEVVVRGSSPTTLTFFLSERAESHVGSERPSDLLNGPAAFLPAADSQGQMVFLQRDAVTIVSVAADHELGDEAEWAEATRVDVEVILEDGSSLQGTISYLMPEGQGRLQDFLNRDDRFLPIQEGNTVRLINKRRIVRVSAL